MKYEKLEEKIRFFNCKFWIIVRSDTGNVQSKKTPTHYNIV